MTVASDADLFHTHFSNLGLIPATAARGYHHMGAVLVDSALQPHTNYDLVVAPRVRRLVLGWPDATTTTLFAQRMASEDISRVLPWNGATKLRVLREITNVMITLKVDTVDDLYFHYVDPARVRRTREKLRAIHGVGPKTVDYLAILAGVREHAAIDTRLINFAVEAGIANHSYDFLSEVMRNVAIRLGCGARDLDSAVWHYMGTK